MERSRAASRPARPPLRRRSRRRWLAAAGIAACWVVLLDQTHSIIAASMLLVLLAAVTIVTVVALRALGITRDHPWAQRMAARPWRDGQEVLRLALRHLPEVLVITPSGSLLAPNLVDIQMNPDDLGSLSEHMELNLAAQSAAEVYVEQVAQHGARLAGTGPAEVHVLADSSVPPGRYRLRQGQPLQAAPRPGFAPAPAGSFAQRGPQLVPAGAWPAGAGSDMPYAGGSRYPGFPGHDGSTRSQPDPATLRQAQADTSPTDPRISTMAGAPTVVELRRSPVPVLRLVTGDSVAQTQVSGARAGRGGVELRLPDEPTVSRVHARVTFSDGQWWITNLGRNGLTLNGAALAGEQPLHHGDSIRWGMRSDALRSRVEIG
jgi:FHA domain